MLEIRTHLTRQARWLILQADDIQQVMPGTTERTPMPSGRERKWEDIVNAPKTLGPESPVDLWVLAKYFLIEWLEWRDTTERWSRYYGVQEGMEPETWELTRGACQTLANTLLHDQVLASVICRQETETTSTDESHAAPPDAYDLCHRYAHNVSLRYLAAAWKGFFKEDITANLEDHLNQQQEQLHEYYQQSPEEDQTFVRDSMRSYRRSLLAYSWLLPTVNRQELIQWYSCMEGKTTHIKSFQDSDVSLSDMRERVECIIGEIGYDAFVEDLLSKDYVGGPDSILNPADVNIIPGGYIDHCRPIVVVVSRGTYRRSPVAFSRVMELLKSHLFTYKGTVSGAMVICDRWDSATFKRDHYPFIRVCHQAGIVFEFLLVKPDERTVSPITVDL